MPFRCSISKVRVVFTDTCIRFLYRRLKQHHSDSDYQCVNNELRFMQCFFGKRTATTERGRGWTCHSPDDTWLLIFQQLDVRAPVSSVP